MWYQHRKQQVWGRPLKKLEQAFIIRLYNSILEHLYLGNNSFLKGGSEHFIYEDMYFKII